MNNLQVIGELFSVIVLILGGIVFCAILGISLTNYFRMRHIYIKPLSFLKMINEGEDPCKWKGSITVTQYYSENIGWILEDKA